MALQMTWPRPLKQAWPITPALRAAYRGIWTGGAGRSSRETRRTYQLKSYQTSTSPVC
jgi:hypothetical protein